MATTQTPATKPTRKRRWQYRCEENAAVLEALQQRIASMEEKVATIAERQREQMYRAAVAEGKAKAQFSVARIEARFVANTRVQLVGGYYTAPRATRERGSVRAV